MHQADDPDGDDHVAGAEHVGDAHLVRHREDIAEQPQASADDLIGGGKVVGVISTTCTDRAPASSH